MLLYLFALCAVGIGCESPPAPASQTSPSASAVSASAAASASAPGEGSSAPAASASASVSASAPASSVSSVPILFVATKGDAESFLFGTMHTGVDAEKELHPIVFHKLAAAKVVVLEADVFNADAMMVMKTAMLPAGQSLKTKIAPARWKIVVDRLASFLMPESTLAQMKPWFVGTMLVQKMLPEVEPMDAVIYQRAKKDGKQIEFLETVEQQLKLVDKSFDVKVLDDMLGELDKTEKMTKDMASAYRRGEIDALSALVFDPEERKKHPAMFDVLFDARNAAWIPKLEPLLGKGSVFVAVGAGHLLGDKGVPALLTAKGFSVARITLP